MCVQSFCDKLCDSSPFHVYERSTANMYKDVCIVMRFEFANMDCIRKFCVACMMCASEVAETFVIALLFHVYETKQSKHV